MRSENYNSGVSLVLSGGGTRGAIHLGVLKALDENNIKVNCISGSSIGSIVGVLYCQGIPPDEILKMINTSSFLSAFKFSWVKGGLLEFEKLKLLLEEHIPHNDFSKLNIPFYCCATNLEKGEFEIFNSGNLHQSVIASASIPLIFEPININGKTYVDGGLFNNLPIEPLLENGFSNIVGVHADNYHIDRDNNLRTIAEKIFAGILKHNVKPNLKKCDYVINPYLKKHYGTLDFSKISELFDIGYSNGVSFINEHISTLKIT